MLKITNLWLTITCIPTTSSSYLHRRTCQKPYLSRKKTSDGSKCLQWSIEFWPICMSNVKKTKRDDTTGLETTHSNYMITVGSILPEINRNMSYTTRFQRIIHVWQRRWTNRVVVKTSNHIFKSIKKSRDLFSADFICVEFCMILAFSRHRQQWFKAVHDKQYRPALCKISWGWHVGRTCISNFLAALFIYFDLFLSMFCRSSTGQFSFRLLPDV
jgi:hypothetical protein